MIVIGLTGSIGMGKSTTARLFAEHGARLWCADEAVHRLYAAGGTGAAAIADLAPGAVSNGAVDRTALRAAILADPALLPRIEAAVHPLVRADRAAFLDAARSEGAVVAVCDIPLLLETGDTADFDAIVVCSAPAPVQRDRVLARPGMTETAFEAIIARQMPDADKRARADYIVDTGGGIGLAREQVAGILSDLRERGGDA